MPRRAWWRFQPTLATPESRLQRASHTRGLSLNRCRGAAGKEAIGRPRGSPPTAPHFQCHPPPSPSPSATEGWDGFVGRLPPSTEQPHRGEAQGAWHLHAALHAVEIVRMKVPATEIQRHHTAASLNQPPRNQKVLQISRRRSTERSSERRSSSRAASMPFNTMSF